MTTFNDREKSFEKKFAMDEELKFKAESRRNRLLGQWAAGKLGLSGAAVDDYVKAVRKADLAAEGRRRRLPQDQEGPGRQGRRRPRRRAAQGHGRFPGLRRSQIRSRAKAKSHYASLSARCHRGRAMLLRVAPRARIDLAAAPHYLLASERIRPPPPEESHMASKSRMAQRASIASVDPIWAELRQEAEEVVRNEPALGGFIYATILSQDRLEDAVCHRLAQRLNHSDVDAGPHRPDLHAGARRSPRARPGLPRRSRRRLRSRSRLQPLHRAAALLQGLPCPRHAPLRPRAAEAGPARLRALPAEPELAHLCRRHQSGRQDRHRHHARSRHRHRHRRDGDASATTARCCRA